MRQRVFLVALAGVMALGLFGCGGGGYETGSGFQGGAQVNLSGRYDLYSKDPGILPNFYSLQIFQSGNSLEAIDNLGRTWTGTMSNPVKYGVYAAGALEEQDITQTGQQQQQQVTIPEGWTADIYLQTQTTSGTITFTAVIDTQVQLTFTTDTSGQQQQQTTAAYSVIMGTVVEESGGAGSLTLYNPIGVETGTQQP